MAGSADRWVLVVEDDHDLARLVKLQLEDIGCRTDCAYDGCEGLELARSGRYGLVILDLGLPGVGGIEICRRVRELSSYTPILMLTAKSTEFDRVFGLEAGADDYLTKPFSIMELVARVKAIFRRAEATDRSPRAEVGAEPLAGRLLRRGELEIDRARRSVRLGSEPIELTAKEFDLLVHFAEHPGHVFNRVQLLDKVWGYGHDGYEHTVNSHINRLRAKIEASPRNPRFILTVWGVGYKFSESPHDSREST